MTGTKLAGGLAKSGPTHALTVLQPWAWAIASGLKTIENRSWQTKYRGPLYIHAGSKIVPSHFRACEETLRRDGGRTEFDPKELATGALIATAELVDCGHFPDDPWAMDDHWHWRLANVVRLPEPVPMRGALKFWRVL